MDYAALQRVTRMFEAPRLIHLVRHPAAAITPNVASRLDEVSRTTIASALGN